MNQSVLPCDDFYEFACGNFKGDDDSSIPSSMENTTFTRLQEVVDNIKDTDPKYKRDIRSAFRSCLEKKYVTTEDIREYIQDVGGWPLVDKDANKQSWSSLAGQIKSQYMIEPLLRLDFQLDDKVPVAIPTSVLTVGGMISRHLKAENVTKLAKDLYPDKCLCTHDIQVKVNAQKVEDFAAALDSLISQTDDNSYFQPADFAQRFPEFQLLNFMTAFISADAWSQFQSRMLLSLPYSNSTIAAISALLKDTDEDTIVNYMVYMFAKALQTVDPSAPYNVYKHLPDWEECLRNLSRNSELGSAVVSAFYNDNYNSSMPDQYHVERLQADMTDIDVLMRQARSPWLSAAAKVELNQMILGLKHYLGLPTWPEQQLDEYYKRLNINESESFPVVSRKLRAFYDRSSIATFLADGTTPEFPNSPSASMFSVLEINALYMTSSYIILNGFLQAPLYSSYRMPTSAKFGVFTVIGHEIGHSVDYMHVSNNSRSPVYDAIGKNMICLQDTYGYLGPTGIWNGPFRLYLASQIIADVSGLRATYLAFKAWQEKHSPGVDHRLPGLEYSAEQIMYIKYAQMACSTQNRNNVGVEYARVTVTVNNDVEFPRLFGCSNRTRCDYLI